jgi:hypothetical protein
MSSSLRNITPALGALASVALSACSNGDAKTPATKADEDVVWMLDNTQSIGGQTPMVLGEPAVTDGALCFDGTNDALIFPAHPLAGLTKFTVEVRFLPDGAGPAEQRFIHMQEAATVNRVLIETRIDPDARWHLDTYLRSGAAELTLVDPTKMHPADTWHWAALSYDGATQRHFVDGVEELSGEVAFAPLAPGQMSLGTRLNQVDWFKGCASELRVHARPLASEELSHD